MGPGKLRCPPARAGPSQARGAPFGGRRAQRAPGGSRSYLYFESISQTDFYTSRCTIVSRPTPPFCEFETPSTDCEVAPISIFSSV